MAQGWCFTATNPRQIVRFTEWELADNEKAAAIMGANCATRISHLALLKINHCAPCSHESPSPTKPRVVPLAFSGKSACRWA